MRLHLTLLAAVVFLPLAVAGRDKFDFYINETVFLKPGAEARVNDTPVDIQTIPFPPTVEKRDGDTLWLEKAWVNKKYVMNARQAVEYYTEQTQNTPNDAVLWRNLGVAWQYTRVAGQYDHALKNLTESLRLDPNDAVTYRGRAQAWTHLQKRDEALKDLTEAIRLNPKDAEAFDDRGALFLWKGQPEQAINDLTEAIRLDPSNAHYYQNRGSWLRDLGDIEGCLNDYGEIIRLCDSGRADEHRYGFAYSVTARIKSTWPEAKYRDGKKALELATRAYEISSKDTKPRGFEEPGVIEVVAFAAAEAGEFDDAIKWAKLALKWLQKEPNNYQGEASLKESKSELESCIELFKNHKTHQDPGDCNDIAWAKATCQATQYRDGKRALELAKMACELSGWKKAKYLETFAAACAETGDFTKAIEWQQKAIELDKSNEVKEGMKERLEKYRENQPWRE